MAEHYERVKQWFGRRFQRRSTRARHIQSSLFPPRLTLAKKVAVGVSWASVVGGSILAADQFWFDPPAISLLTSCHCWAYIGLGLAIVGIVSDRCTRHKVLVFRSRLEDPSSVEASIQKAKTVEPRIFDPEIPVNYRQKKAHLLRQVRRLEKIGIPAWTEYQVLTLDQMLVDFMKVDDLKANAQAELDSLKEYAQDSAYRYDSEFYTDWKLRIDDAHDRLAIPGTDAKNTDYDTAAEPLRAELRMLLDHVADYQANWKEGSTILNSLRIGGVAAIVLLLLMGLVPVLHPLQGAGFGLLNWGLLGISGSLIAVLRDLRNSNLAEVGNTEGRIEVARAVLGCALGLVAGIVTYALVGGGLLEGSAFPDIQSTSLHNVSLSILIGTGSGYAFERVFDRLQNIGGTMQ